MTHGEAYHIPSPHFPIFTHSFAQYFVFQTICFMPPKKSGSRKKYEKMKAAQIVPSMYRNNSLGEAQPISVDELFSAACVWRYGEGSREF